MSPPDRALDLQIPGPPRPIAVLSVDPAQAPAAYDPIPHMPTRL